MHEYRNDVMSMALVGTTLKERGVTFVLDGHGESSGYATSLLGTEEQRLSLAHDCNLTSGLELH